MAKLPNAHLAHIEPAKITEYLLSPSHPKGGTKAEFFSRFGFTAEHWQVLRDVLIEHVASCEVAREIDSPSGVRYLVDGPLQTPDGRNPLVRGIWLVEPDNAIPRFITAYPLRRRNA